MLQRKYFAGFANVWTPVMASSRLGTAPVALTVAGEKLVLFRGRSGPAALFDRCPHRGVALSVGQVRDGCIECPFHGWRFDERGAARVVPWNPEARTELLGATSLPVAEAGGLVWLYTAPGQGAPALPAVAQRLARRSDSLVTEQVVKTHWSRVMENLLDAPHLPFVHRYTIGMAARGPAVEGAPMETSYTADEEGGVIHWAVSGSVSGANRGSIRHYVPNMMQLGTPGAQLEGDAIPEQLVAAVPIDGRQTRTLSIVAPGFSLFRVLDTLFGRRLSWEDNHVVETSDPPEIPRGGGEVSVQSDRATLAFRRYYDSRLRDSWASTPTAGEVAPVAAP